MNALEKHIAGRIRTQGPLSVADFMAEALGHPQWGYYMKQDPFGTEGDFTTAPEISQMFGEIMGLWLGQAWLDLKQPQSVHLIELGPGRGTLMRDVLRAMAVIPALTQALEIHLVETSPVLRRIQADNLKDLKNPNFHNAVTAALIQAAGAPVLILANEFFDALPVRQFERMAGGWYERQISLAGDRLCFSRATTAASDTLIPTEVRQADLDSIVEICPIAEQIMAEIADYIAAYGGAALIIDYGYTAPGTGDTLQAVKAHQPCPVLSDPGNVDLTTHVNFHRLKAVIKDRGAKDPGTRDGKLTIHGPVPQGAFLLSLGLEARKTFLMKRASPAQQADITSAAHRLIDPDAMGSLFKVLAVQNLIPQKLPLKDKP